MSATVEHYPTILFLGKMENIPDEFGQVRNVELTGNRHSQAGSEIRIGVSGNQGRSTVESRLEVQWRAETQGIGTSATRIYERRQSSDGESIWTLRYSSEYVLLKIHPEYTPHSPWSAIQRLTNWLQSDYQAKSCDTLRSKPENRELTSITTEYCRLVESVIPKFNTVVMESDCKVPFDVQRTRYCVCQPWRVHQCGRSLFNKCDPNQKIKPPFDIGGSGKKIDGIAIRRTSEQSIIDAAKYFQVWVRNTCHEDPSRQCSVFVRCS